MENNGKIIITVVICILVFFAAIFFALLNSYITGSVYNAKIQSQYNELISEKGRSGVSYHYDQADFDVSYVITGENHVINIENIAGGRPSIELAAENKKGENLIIDQYKVVKNNNCVAVGRHFLKKGKIMISFANCSSDKIANLKPFEIYFEIKDERGRLVGSEILKVQLVENGYFRIKDSL